MFSRSLIVFVAVVASARASCMHGTSLLPRQEGKVDVSNFGYSGEQGPLNWAGLAAENVACRTGTIQSPIVLDNTTPFATEKPKLTIAPVEEAEFENLGTTLETIVTGETEFAGAKFKLQQFHLHTPSEHRINEEYFPLEMHLVHEGDGGAIAVIAVPFQLSEDGKTTELLTSVIKNIADVQVPGTATKTGALDFTELIAAVEAGPLFQYTGSLTTPPCAEGLTFLVLEKPLPLDVKTFNTLKSIIKFNARYTQNNLGKTNLLDVAVNLAAREAGAAPINANVDGAADKNNTVVDANGNTVTVNDQSNVDINELVQQLVAQNKNLKFDTVTTTTTTVSVVDENGQQDNQGQDNNGAGGAGEAGNAGQDAGNANNGQDAGNADAGQDAGNANGDAGKAGDDKAGDAGKAGEDKAGEAGKAGEDKAGEAGKTGDDKTGDDKKGENKNGENKKGDNKKGEAGKAGDNKAGGKKGEAGKAGDDKAAGKEGGKAGDDKTGGKKAGKAGEDKAGDAGMNKGGKKAGGNAEGQGHQQGQAGQQKQENSGKQQKQGNAGQQQKQEQTGGQQKQEQTAGQQTAGQQQQQKTATRPGNIEITNVVVSAREASVKRSRFFRNRL